MQDCHVARLYFLQGNLTEEEAKRLASEVLADPVTEEWSIVNGQLSIANDFTIHNSQFTIHNYIESTLDPGVTDPPADTLIAAANLLGITNLERAATGHRFYLSGHLKRPFCPKSPPKSSPTPWCSASPSTKRSRPPSSPIRAATTP
ncbi:MAG: hypothetical protein M5U34_21105 [Chloroflexi bacterium]|nr:hypothetical protein [Chloroflexota bacterium]